MTHLVPVADGALVATGIHKRYGSTRALAGVDLRIDPGEIVALLGPNGAGKTTLMSIVTGLLRPDAGSVLVAGVDVMAQPARARRMLGFAGQETAVYPTLPVRENLRFAGELARLRGAPLARRVGEIAEALLLTELLERPARHLSGGEARRLHTAMALVHRPPVLLLDEPTSGVDAATRSRLLDVVRELARAGSAVCYCTHYFGEVEQLDPLVTILDRGSVVARGAMRALLAEHAESVLELRFDGTPPEIAGRRCVVSGESVRVTCEGSAALDAATVLGMLGEQAARLRAVELIEPSLESVFLSVTGRRPQAGDGEEVAHGAVG